MHRFADLKNDAAFRRVFGQSPDLVAALLDDLLGRDRDARRGSVEIITERPPDPAAAALPLVSVRCRDARATFIVEVQILHVPGFLERSMHEAARVYVEQPRAGFSDLAPVIAVSICDFELWPDRTQDARRAPRVPMLSRWRMTESDSGADGSAHVQHVVLEVPKLHGRPPESATERWAWLFRHAAELVEIPPAWPRGPERRALELADLSTWSATELEGYRRARDAVEQTREAVRDGEARGRREGIASGRHEGVVQGKRDGLIEGEIKGRREALREALLTWIDERGLRLSAAERARIEGEPRLDLLRRFIARAARADRVAEILAEPPEPTPPQPPDNAEAL